MKITRKLLLGLVIVAGMAPSAAMADDPPTTFEVVLEDGMCGTMECTDNGCSVISTYPCPREVGGPGN